MLPLASKQLPGGTKVIANAYAVKKANWQAKASLVITIDTHLTATRPGHALKLNVFLRSQKCVVVVYAEPSDSKSIPLSKLA